MRSMLAAAVAALLVVGLTGDHVVGPGSKPDTGPGARALAALIDKAVQSKPGARPTLRGDDSCRWANDRECDEPGIGTGACVAGTDVSDCRYIIQGEADACRWANDGECDEPGFGTGACVQGSDLTDCGAVAHLRFRNDSCATAFNGVCEEPEIGTGTCPARTDRRDCFGAERPLTINDHFFGRDDRVFMDQATYPWTLVGQLRMDTGESCTATLIGEDILITAAHCIHNDDGVDARARFTTAVGLAGGPYEARVTHYYVDRNFDYARFSSTDEIDGLDWALLRIDRPLGRTLGYAGVRNLTGEGAAVAMAAELHQAGYSWDTGDHLSGNIGCHMVAVYPDNTFAHECDTTRGDSGSPFLVRNGDRWQVVGVDSNFRSNPNGPFMYIAASAAGFQRYVADFATGRIGRPVGGRGGRRPKAD